MYLLIQTPATWTLRDFHNQGGANNFKPHQPGIHDESSLNPPPIPARRLASHPPVPPTHHAQPQPLPVTLTSPERTSESHSAPSSPTRETKQLALPAELSPVLPRNGSVLTTSSRTSPTPRPRSMMVDISSQELGYSTVKFSDSLNQKPYQPRRRDTKYSEISHIVKPATLGAPEAPIPIPRSRSLDRKQNPQLVPSEAENSPPSDNAKVESQNVSDADPFLSNEDPFANNPFDNDPFADDIANEWRDNTVFYDHPPPPRPYTAGMEVPKAHIPEPAAVADDYKSDGETADCTDESAYQDTKDFLEGVQAKHRGEEFQIPALVQNENPHFTPAADLFVPELKDSEPSQSVSEPVPKHSPTFSKQASSAYEYPAILDKHPKKPEDSKISDEPPLHTLTYSKHAPTPSDNLTRSESLKTSGRRGMPLPPLPDNQDQPPSTITAHPDLSSPPPLPARPVAGPSGYQAPSLPPFNHPWGNKKQRSEETPSNPPLPPRRKEQAPVFNGGNEPPKPEANSSVTELLALGYTLSEIERALLISKNDLTLAKLILKEFGGRY